MSDQTPLDLEAIRARLDAATPAPWKDDGDVSGIVAASGERVTEGDNSGYGCVYISDADRALIAHAPTDLRRLLDENARLTAENERYLRVINEITADNAGLTGCLDAVQEIHRVETYAFGTRTSLGHRVGCYICKTDGPCPTSIAASEMPRPPAEEAQERPETPGTGSGRGTGVAEDENPAQECDHWFTDVAEAVRPAHYRQAAGELLALVAHFEHIGSERTEWMAGLRDGAEHLARSTSDAAPSLPVPSTEAD